MKKDSSNTSFSKGQIWGISILIGLILIIVALWRLFPLLLSDNKPIDTPQSWTSIPTTDNSENEKFVNTPHSESEEVKTNQTNSNNTKASAVLFPFDPNTASLDDFVKLGLSPKVSQTIINYRTKGGKFYKKEDFSKIYTLSDNDFQRLLPYIQIKNTKPDYATSPKNYTSTRPSNYPNNRPNYNYPQKSNKPVNVNTGTIEELMELKGIGTGFANRIVKYRDILGGYYKIEQIQEVYGMTDSLYEAIKPYLIIDKSQILKIDINQASEESLYKHPYIRKMAKHIITYRTAVGGFKQIEEFKQVPLINDEIYRKIVPYLSITN